MSSDLNTRIDELERKLRSLEQELVELRALASAQAAAPAVTAVEAPPVDVGARLRALADSVRTAQAAGATWELRALADEAAQLAPSAPDSRWRAYALQLAEYAQNAAAAAPASAPAPQRTQVAPVRARLRSLADAVRSAEAAGKAGLLRDIATELDQLAAAESDPKWRAYALELAAYARSVAAAATPRPAAAPRPVPAVTRPAASAASRPSAAGPAPRRAAERPSAKPRSRTAADLVRDWDLLGARGVALAGGVVTLLGIVFFFVLATNRGWIGPVARVSLGAAASALVFSAGLVVHRRYGQLHAALAACGTGVAGGYATLAAATILYGLLPAAGALVAASAIATVGVVVALAWSSQALAALGFLGAALSPAALALDEGVSAAGTAFAAVVFAALAVVAVRRRWDRLLASGAAVTVVQAVWLVSEADAGDTATAVVAGAVAALLVAAAAAWQLALPREGLDALAGSLAATAVAVSLGSAVRLYPDETEQALALLVAGAGLAVAAALLVRRALDLAYVLGAGALLLGGVATADLLSGTSLAVVFAAQSILASAIAHRLRERRFLLGAYGYLGVALFEAVSVQAEWVDGAASGGEAALGLAATAGASLAAGLLAPAEATRISGGVLAVLEPLHAWLGRSRVDLRALLAVAAFVLGVVASSDVLSGAWLAASWAGAAVLFSVAGWRLAELRLVPFALGSAVLAAAHAVVVDAPVEWEFEAAAGGAASLAAAGAAALVVGLLLPAAQRGIARLGPLADGERALAGLVDARVQLRALLAALAAALVALATADVLSETWLAVAYAGAAIVLALAAWRLAELRFVPFALASGGLAATQALIVAAPIVPDLYPELSAGLSGAAAVAAAGLAIAVAAQFLPPGQRGLARLGSLAGPETVLNGLVAHRLTVRLLLAALAGALGLAAAGLALVDVLGDAGHVAAVVLWSAAGLAAVAVGAARLPALAWAGGGLLAATLVKAYVYDWPELGADQAAAELLVCAAAILAAGWLVRALSPSAQPVAAASAVAAGVALHSTIVALDQLIDSSRLAGAALVGVAAVYAALAAAAQREPRLRNLATAMWLPGLFGLLLGEALVLQDRNIAVAYAVTAVALAWIAAAIGERRLWQAALVLLGGTTVVTLMALTPPTRLLEASEHPGTSGWTIAACALAWAVLAALEPTLRERLGWLAAALGVYTASLVILELAERVSSASVQTDFERGHTAVSALWGAIGLGLLVAGLLRDSRAFRLGGLALFGISLAKLFLYDLSTLSSITRAFSFLVVGALLLAGGFFLQKLSRRLDQAPSPPASQP